MKNIELHRWETPHALTGLSYCLMDSTSYELRERFLWWLSPMMPDVPVKHALSEKLADE